MWREINENLNKAAGNQKAQHDKHVNERTFQAGDLVCIIDDKPKVSKNINLVKWWTGPYVLTKMISDTNALIHRKPTGKEEIVHILPLKIYHSLPMDYTEGHSNRDGEPPQITYTSTNARERIDDTLGPTQPQTTRYGLPDIPVESEEEAEPSPPNKTQ